MKEAARPVHDQKRVESLRKLQLLDTPIEERFERITRMACHVLNMPITAFTLVDDTRQTFKSVQGLDGADVPREISLCGHIVASESMLIVPDTQKDERFLDNPLVNGNPAIKFYAGCPVRAPDGETIGAFCAIDTRPRDMSPEQVQSLQDMAAMVETELRASMLSRAQTELLDELNVAQRSALIDPLTRLWNRNGISELLKREWDLAVQNKTALSIVMADIDRFKKINDAYGHPIGDAILRYAGHHLLTHLRSDDIIGRMGGEEFLLVLPKCQLSHLGPAVERIRKSFESSPVQTDAGDIPITISFGAVAAVPHDALSVEQVIARADEALYVAKNTGRNRAEIVEF